MVLRCNSRAIGFVLVCSKADLPKFSVVWYLNLHTDPWFLPFHRFGAQCLLSSTGSTWQSKPRNGSCCTPWIPTNSELASFWSSFMKGGMTRLLSLLTMCLLWRNMPFDWTSKNWNVKSWPQKPVYLPHVRVQKVTFFLEALRNFLVSEGLVLCSQGPHETEEQWSESEVGMYGREGLVTVSQESKCCFGAGLRRWALVGIWSFRLSGTVIEDEIRRYGLGAGRARQTESASQVWPSI